MKSPRTLVAALCALAFVVSPAHALAQTGAGDDQYQDPFAGQSDGGSSSGGGSDSGGNSGGGGGGTSNAGTGDSGTAAADTSGDAGLSTAPPDSSLTTPPPLGTSSTGTTATSQATLPNTGVDTRLLVGAGIALLLMGIGLRLRTADERRY